MKQHPLHHTPQNPSEMTGSFHLYHPIQSLHPHLHIILPLLSVLIHHLSTHLHNQNAQLVLETNRNKESLSLFINKTEITFYNTSVHTHSGTQWLSGPELMPPCSTLKELIRVSSNPSLTFPLIHIEFEFQHLTRGHNIQVKAKSLPSNSGSLETPCSVPSLNK